MGGVTTDNCDRSSGRSRIGTGSFLLFSGCAGTDCDRSSGRSRIGTQNLLHARQRDLIAIVLRGDRGLEQYHGPGIKPHSALRSFFGAIEDWNSNLTPEVGAALIAIVLRGDRGLEHPI